MVKQGPSQMRDLLRACGIGAVIAAATGPVAAPALAQQDPSPQSVRVLMDYAWDITPDRFTKPNGQTVVIDPKNRSAAEVPLETAKEIIRVARLSAHAQVCDLKEEHTTTFRTLMGREAIKKKWTEQQFVFMNQLHMVTVMLLTGQLKVIEREQGKDGKEVQVAEESIGKKATCTTEQRSKVKEAITAYLKSGPQLVPAEASAGGFVPPAATPASAPAPTKK